VLLTAEEYERITSGQKSITDLLAGSNLPRGIGFRVSGGVCIAERTGAVCQLVDICENNGFQLVARVDDLGIPSELREMALVDRHQVICPRSVSAFIERCCLTGQK
jgi:hypothetical protein